MTKILSCLPTALLTLSCFTAAPSQAAESGATPADYHLVQVLALSRHGIRAPLVNYGDALAEATPHHWPKWQTEGGLLTPKDGKVENHVGHYFHAWLAQNHLFGERGCPKGDAVFVYANSLPRTIDTAKFFLDGAFPGCDIPVNHQTAVGTMDPTFNPIITAAVSENFKTAALNSIAQHAGPGGIDGLNTRLKPNYQLLEQVLDYSQSQACQRDKRCSLATQPSSVVLEQGKEPAITGPLRTGTGASDAFMLQYYEGFPLRDVGWGKITTPAQWRQLEAIKNLYHETLFGSPAIAANAAKPLLTFIAGALNAQPPQGERQQAAQRAALTLLAAMKVRDYQLPDQFERTPISGAIVFQRWHDDKQNRDLMKIEYVYPTSRQIRNDSALSLASPPRRVTLAIDGCPLDVAGFCPMSDFKQAVMRDLRG